MEMSHHLLTSMLINDFTDIIQSYIVESENNLKIPNLDELEFELMITSSKPKFIISPSAFIKSYSRENNKYITHINEESIQNSLIDVSSLYLHDILSIIKGLMIGWGVCDYFVIVMEDLDGRLSNNIICYNPNNENYDEQYKFY